MRLRRLLTPLAVMVLAGASVLLSGGGPATGDAQVFEPLLGSGRVAAAEDVPWDRVGDGWYLAVVDKGSRTDDGWVEPRRELLELVNPRGGRYEVFETRVRDGRGSILLVDWSLDAGTALMVVDNGLTTQRALAVDLRSGAEREVRLPRTVADIALRPDGDGLFATTFGSAAPGSRRLLTLDWTGVRSVVATGVGSNVLPSADGTQLVSGPTTSSGRALRVLDAATGDVTARVPLPMGCDPYRWWAPGVVAARCWGDHQAIELWAVPLDGSAATQLSTYHGRRSDDLGDVDARQLGGLTYLQATGPCGFEFLARQEADGSATTVDVPGAVGNVQLVDATDASLVIQHAVSCDGGTTRSVLAHFDPAGSTESVMVRLPRNQSFGRILVHGERPVMGF
ncbi:MAG: hypothetical protein U0R80_09355 [Nocardioidaceae bacterium]